MDVTAMDMMLGAMVIPTDVTTPAQFSSEAMAQTSTTFGTMGELAEPDSTTGNDIGGFIFYQPVSSGGNTATVTMSATAGGTTTNVRGPGVIFRARLLASYSISPSQGNLALSGTAPTVGRTTNADITPSQGNIALSGTAPTVSQGIYRDVPQGNLVITTTVPTVAQTAHISLTPSQGNLVLSGTAPTIDQTAHQWVYPAQADLTLSGTAPTVSTGAHIALSPDQANLALSTTAPTVDRTAHIGLSPAQSNLSLSTFAPEIQAGGNVGKSPASADLVLSATAPTVGATANVNIGPASADIVLSTFAPTIDSGVAVVVTPRPSGGGRVIGYSPPLRLKKKKVTVLLPQDNDELIRRLREIDAGYQKRRQEQLQDLLASMRHALMWGQEVTLQGYDLLTRADIEATRRKVQQEEESLLLLLQ